MRGSDLLAASMGYLSAEEMSRLYFSQPKRSEPRYPSKPAFVSLGSVSNVLEV